jgi:hypothetical protein
MATTMKDLGIDRLSVPERLALVDEILDSLPEQVDLAEVPPWHLPEIARRRADAVERRGVGRPWRDVLGPLEAGS